MIQKYCKGSKSNYFNVIKTLKNLGGNNAYNFDGRDENALYYINSKNIIESACDAKLQEIIKNTFEEIIIEDPFKEDDLLINLDGKLVVLFSKYGNENKKYFYGKVLFSTNLSNYSQNAWLLTNNFKKLSNNQRTEISNLIYSVYKCGKIKD